MNYEQFQEIKKLRQILNKEIVLEFDAKPEWDVYSESWEAIRETACNLHPRFNFEIYFHEKGKSPHLHLKNFNRGLSAEEKKAFALNFVPVRYHFALDFSLYGKHLIACEEKPHFKYRTIKRLLGIWNEDKQNIFPEDLAVKEEPKVFLSDGLNEKLIGKFSIRDVAARYGLKPTDNCPFHDDKGKNFWLNTKKNTFKCFSPECGVGGDLVTFIAKMKVLRGEIKDE